MMISWERATRVVLGKERESGDEGGGRRERHRAGSAADRETTATT
jgi:hypothetical protein